MILNNKIRTSISSFVFSNPALKNFYNWINKGERMLSRDEIFNNDSKENPIDRSNSNFNLVGNKLLKENNINISKDIPSIFGWVPYIKNKTNVFLYHFFSVNYGLRKNILSRVSLVREKNVVKQNCFWLPVFGTEEIDLINLWHDLDGDTLFVEMFHPRMSQKHGAHDGHLRCWGKYYNNNKKFTCTTHSMGLEKKSKFLKKSIWTRGLISQNDGEETFHYSSNYKIKKNDDSLKTHLGFTMVIDKNMNPLSVWHEGGVSPKSIRESDKNTLKTMQGFWCPPTNLLDPLLFIDEKETELTSNNINLYLLDGENIKMKKNFSIKGSFKMKVSEIFEKKITGPYVILCEFYYNKFAYLNISYDKFKSSGDNVHAHECSWIINNNILSPKNVKKRGSARKFLHFKKKENDSESTYLLIHINKIENEKNGQLKLRLLLDNQKEFIKNIDIKIKEPISVFNLDNIFESAKHENFKNGIIQLESFYNNLNASFINFDSESGIAATDHLTGG